MDAKQATAINISMLESAIVVCVLPGSVVCVCACGLIADDGFKLLGQDRCVATWCTHTFIGLRIQGFCSLSGPGTGSGHR
jgi:hypothetical protein